MSSIAPVSFKIKRTDDSGTRFALSIVTSENLMELISIMNLSKMLVKEAGFL